jgi:signal transduction histidine kinase/CheY-like chemotaxis protein
LIEYARDLRESVENQRKLNEMNERNLELDFERKEAHRAREAALEASRVKSDFLASMSHEIRTPMNAIIGMSDLMRTDNLDDTQKLYFADISKMAHSLLQIINDILDFSKIEAGKMELVPTHYNIHALYDNICSITRFTLANKSLSFVQGISDDMPDILFGDETRVRQIINNLLSNSVKYTLEGYIELRLNRVNRRDRDYFSISVSDTGVGIREEDIPKLFDKFAQFDVGSHKAASGTGLGLPITKQFVEMMNGSITVQSEYGKGSTFTVYLPLVLGDPAHLKQVETLKRVIASPEVKVLVVDDNAINLTVARGYLLRHGIDAETAESGAAAIEMLKKQHYDLVFMDHMMPEMDGIEATLLIRQMDGGRLKKMPIVALTANAIVGMREVFLGAGMDGYISKPINPQELNHALMTLLPPEMLTVSDETVTASLTPLSPTSLSALHTTDLVLDQRVGAANFQNDEKLYKKILGDFKRNHGTDFETIISMLLAGDVQGARRVAHTLKSTGATIGAENLRRTAFAVETALAEKGQCGDDTLELLSKELTRVLDELKSILPAPAQTEAEGRPIQREAGLKNVANDEKLYLKLLHEFRKSNSDDMHKLDEALAGNDFVTAHRIVHTLKGTAALIGAQKLHRIAASVVLDLKDQKKNDAQLALFKAAFNEVMGELALLGDNNTGSRASSTGVVDRKKMQTLLEKLEASLVTGSADSLGLMDELQGTLSACGVDYAALEAKINDLDFPGALDALLALRQTLDATDEGESSGRQA